MKLIHTKLARSIWLFDIRDLNPGGKDIMGDIVKWIRDTYGFAEAPDPGNPVPNGAPQVPTMTSSGTPPAAAGLVFKRGNFPAEEKQFIGIHALTIYDDGIVVDMASSTEDGDKFAADLLKSATSVFALDYDADTVRIRLYLSELIVRSSINLESLSPALSKFARTLSASTARGSQLSFEVGGISFWSDIDDAGKHRAVRFERQSGRAFSENRYFSEAPMPTAKHYAALEDFERLVMEQ